MCQVEATIHRLELDEVIRFSVLLPLCDFMYLFSAASGHVEVLYLAYLALEDISEGTHLASMMKMGSLTRTLV